MKKYLIIAGIIIFILLFTFMGGCHHGKKIKVCPTIETGTTIKTDTVDHYIYNIWPWYYEGKDSIVYVDVPAVVDTMKILADYYAKHYSNKKWSDSLLDVDLDMMITQNKFYPQKFKYNIKRPQTIINNTIDNSIHYSRYLYFGTGLPVYPFKANGISNINYLSLEAIYAAPKGYFKVGWQPYTEQFSLSAGVRIVKFKK